MGRDEWESGEETQKQGLSLAPLRLAGRDDKGAPGELGKIEQKRRRL